MSIEALLCYAITLKFKKIRRKEIEKKKKTTHKIHKTRT